MQTTGEYNSSVVNYHHQNKNQNLVQTSVATTNTNDSAAIVSDHTNCQNDLSSIDEESSDMEEDELDENDSDFESTMTPYYKQQFSIAESEEENNDDIVYKIINSPDVTSALDRTNTSTGSFAIILAAIARVLDVDLSECVFSASTLLRRRSTHREIIKTDVKEKFLGSIKSDLVVHFDGKR